MSFPPRLVTILVPVQCLLVILGWAIPRKLLGFMQQNPDLLDLTLHVKGPMPGLLGFASHFGWMLLLVPIAWGITASLRAETSGRSAHLPPVDSSIGLLLKAVLFGLGAWDIALAVRWVLGPISGPLQVAG